MVTPKVKSSSILIKNLNRTKHEQGGVARPACAFGNFTYLVKVLSFDGLANPFICNIILLA